MGMYKLYTCSLANELSHVNMSGPAPAILDWYGHCVRVSVNKLGGPGGMLPQENL